MVAMKHIKHKQIIKLKTNRKNQNKMIEIEKSM